MYIPICDPKQEYLVLKGEIDAAIQGVLEAGHYILGPNVAAFEQEMADYLGCRYAVGVNSGTDALHLAMRALGIGPGDEVITTPFTFIATTEAIGLVGATPVFADIDPQTFNIDPTCIEDAITPRTKAIMPVHLYGQPCDMDAIMDIARRHSLQVVEDCAQALGATYRGTNVGTFGDVGCFSFFPSKNLGCVGDGGMVATSDPDVYERLEMLRRHGGKVKYHHSELGLNSRLDELQAAILRVKLQRLESRNAMRIERAYRYNSLLSNIDGVTCPSELAMQGVRSPQGNDKNDLLDVVYHQYTIRVADRDSVCKAMQDSEVQCVAYYPVPLHLQEVHEDLGHAPGAFPAAEKAARECLSLPMYPELSDSQQDRAVTCLKDLTRQQHRAAA